MKRSTPALPIHHQLPESTQTHVHQVGDAIQHSHPLSSPSPPALNLSQHQGLFQWVSSLHQVAKVLEFQLQHQSFPMNTQGWSPLGWAVWISLQSKGLSRVFSNTTVQKHHSLALCFLCGSHPLYLPDLLPTEYHFFKHLENFFSEHSHTWNYLVDLAVGHLPCLQCQSAWSQNAFMVHLCYP